MVKSFAKNNRFILLFNILALAVLVVVLCSGDAPSLVFGLNPDTVMMGNLFQREFYVMRHRKRGRTPFN